MKAIQVGFSVALVAGVLMFILGGGDRFSITGTITQGQDTTQELNTQLHDTIQTQKEDLRKRIRNLRFPEAAE